MAISVIFYSLTFVFKLVPQNALPAGFQDSMSLQPLTNYSAPVVWLVLFFRKAIVWRVVQLVPSYHHRTTSTAFVRDSLLFPSTAS